MSHARIGGIMEGGENWEDAQQPPKPKRSISRLKVDESLLLNEQKGLRKLYEDCLRFRITGNEVDDLRRLLLLFSEWHFCLAPHFSLEYVVQKLQKLGAKPQIRAFMSRLRKVHKGQLRWEELEMQREEVETEEFIDLKRRMEDDADAPEEKRAKLDSEALEP